MKFGEVETFELSASYDFRVTVKGAEGNFSGLLKLSPDGITIRISGDQQQHRRWGDVEWKLESLRCESFKWSFTLFDLHAVKSGHFMLQSGPGAIQHFEIDYAVSYAVVSPSGAGELDIRELQLFSPTLKEWIGHTEKQEEIVHNQMTGSAVGLKSHFGDFDTREVSVDVTGFGEIYVNYNIKARASPLAFSVGVEFPPSFCVCSNETILPADIMQLYQKSYAFLSLLHGYEIAMDRVILAGDDFISSDSYLYYPKPRLSVREENAYSLYPLGNKIRFDSLGLPPMPLESIATYFSSDYKFTEKWIKYIKYRKMNNAEERFLGYFRLLESLTKNSKTFLDPELLAVQVARIEKIMIKIFKNSKEVKSFLRGISRYNKSKYNTEKCLIDFYKKIPVGRRESWSLKQSAITLICTLRNNISHANDYFELHDDLLAKSAFIESLLIMALLETIDIPIDTSSKVISRLSTSFHLYKQ
jgi:hypothetical protein